MVAGICGLLLILGLKRPGVRAIACLKPLVVLHCLLLSGLLCSQNESSKWYFGTNAGLDFMTSPPTILTGSLVTWEGATSVADASGNLLFYTNGTTVYNQQHAVMATGLQGHMSTTQSSIIVKQPGSGFIYYVFTLDEQAFANGLKYSVVDMSLAAGMGSVTVMNVPLFTPSTEKLTATRHCNGTDVWVVSHDYVGGFRAYLVTTGGVGNVPVLTTGMGSPGTVQVYGAMKISPTGKKLVCAMSDNGGVELFDFDNATGVVSNSLILTTFSVAYGCDFSPDGSKLYVNQVLGDLHQWDLCAGSNAAIIASHYQIPATYTGGMQLAPNGKIYVARSAQADIGVINNPNVAGSGCNYVDQGQSILPNSTVLGVCNFMTSLPPAKVPPSPFTYTVSNIYGCQTASFTSPPDPTVSLVGCTALGYSVTNRIWNFGDPATGISNISIASNPSHAFSALGTYTVQLLLYYNCGTDTLRQLVVINQPCITVSTTAMSCASLGTATVSANNGAGPFSYTWMPSGQTGSVAAGLIPGIYTITVHDQGSNLTYSTEALLTATLSFTGTVLATTTLGCYGASTGTATVINLNGGSGSQTYVWTNGVSTYTTAFISGLGAGGWSVTVTDALTGCAFIQTFIIVQPPPLTLNISALSPTVCAGSMAVLSGMAAGGTPAYTYSWTGGPAVATYSVSELLPGAHFYTLSVTDANACTSTTFTSVYFLNNPVLSLTSVSVCPLQTATLVASGAAAYSWSDGSSSASLIASPAATTIYTVIGSVLGCTAMATASIHIKPLPPALIAGNASLCIGATLSLTASGGTAYNWSGPFGFSGVGQNQVINAVSANDAGVYQVTVTAANACTAVVSGTVQVFSAPVLVAQGSTVCSGESPTLTANSFNASFYQWSGPLGFSSFQQNPVLSNVGPFMSGDYTVTVISADNCSNTANAMLSVVPTPTLSILLSGNGTLCAQALNGSPNTITLTSSGAMTYTLTTPNHMSNPNPVGPVSPLANMPPFQNTLTIATATLSGSNGICTVTSTVTFSILPNPTVSISSPTPFICAGQSYTYTNLGAASYTWGPGAPGLSTYTSPITVASPSITTVFSVIGGSLGCNSGTQTSTLTVYPLPTLTLTASSPGVCPGHTISLAAGGSATAYSWMPAPGLSSATGSSVIVKPESQQAYTVTASLNNCLVSGAITVSVLPAPVASVVLSKPMACLGEKISIKGYGGIRYEWRDPNYTYYQGQAISVTVGRLPGMYSLTVTDENGAGCSSTITFDIKKYPSPEADFSFSPINPLEGQDKVTFINSSSGEKLVSYNWFFIDNEGYTTDAKNTAYLFENAGAYPVAMVVKNTWGCADTMIRYVKVEADFNLYVPNAFTPNQDAMNEVFFPLGSGIREYHLQIFDRWGELLFESNDLLKGWDGSYKGQPAKSDVYAWQISIVSHSGKTKNLAGHVTLYR